MAKETISETAKEEIRALFGDLFVNDMNNKVADLSNGISDIKKVADAINKKPIPDYSTQLNEIQADTSAVKKYYPHKIDDDDDDDYEETDKDKKDIVQDISDIVEFIGKKDDNSEDSLFGRLFVIEEKQINQYNQGISLLNNAKKNVLESLQSTSELLIDKNQTANSQIESLINKNFTKEDAENRFSSIEKNQCDIAKKTEAINEYQKKKFDLVFKLCIAVLTMCLLTMICLIFVLVRI